MVDVGFNKDKKYSYSHYVIIVKFDFSGGGL